MCYKKNFIFFSAANFLFFIFIRSRTEVYNYTSYIIFLTQEQEGVAKLIEMLSRAGGKK